MNRVVIIDNKTGNLASVSKALKNIGENPLITKDKRKINKATHIILPGVGTFSSGIKNLREFDLIEVIRKKVLKNKTPLLGICLGMQLLADFSYEFGKHKGLGLIRGEIIRLKAKKLRLPHIGWNNIKVMENNSLFKEIPDDNFYFVHSYYLKPKNPKIITSTAKYGQEFAASIQQKNIFATQFHPEKSQLSGLRVLNNFFKLTNA